MVTPSAGTFAATCWTILNKGPNLGPKREAEKLIAEKLRKDHVEKSR
jgi:hypothetical protein